MSTLPSKDEVIEDLDALLANLSTTKNDIECNKDRGVSPLKCFGSSSPIYNELNSDGFDEHRNNEKNEQYSERIEGPTTVSIFHGKPYHDSDTDTTVSDTIKTTKVTYSRPKVTKIISQPVPHNSNNLSELDMLLSDLSSAQFAADVNVKNGDNVSYPSLDEIDSASNATRELDDLMTSLSDFKVDADDPLSSMLDDLDKDLVDQGVDTQPKGECFACKQPILGPIVTALGHTWHPEHFQCAECNCELANKNFFERGNLPYCENDYHRLFSPHCAACEGPILDHCITALERTWHPEHFCCSQCNSPLGEQGFHEREETAYCNSCYYDKFAPKCGGCKVTIVDNFISALGKQWHHDCFACMDCNFKFGAGSFFEHEGLPYCETHYHGRRGSLCAACQKPITGRCITAMCRKFHPEHFVCAFCLRQLNKGTFKEDNDKPYCHPCFDKLFG